VEPIDYDAYVEQNYANLRKDQCSKQLILLSSDDIYEEEYEVGGDAVNTTTNGDPVSSSLLQPSSNNLFVSDCLQTYSRRNYDIKYKYHAFGGSYKQLPMYNEYINAFNKSLADKT
jgi:hypothetical protein